MKYSILDGSFDTHIGWPSYDICCATETVLDPLLLLIILLFAFSIIASIAVLSSSALIAGLSNSTPWFFNHSLSTV